MILTNVFLWIEWVKWNGFSDEHEGYDFGAYITADGKVVFGLPENTPVRAIADGHVYSLIKPGGDFGGYAARVGLTHGDHMLGLGSQYDHMIPHQDILDGKNEVKKGETIGHLYKDPGNKEGRLVHLHFMLTSGGMRPKIVDPSSMFDGLDDIIANPQGSPDFRLSGLSYDPKIIVANFKKVNTGYKI